MMRSIVVEDVKRVAQKDVEIPKPKADEVLIKVSFAGICGTDFAIYSGDTDLVREDKIKYPVRIGHEWSGMVCKVGEAVTDFSVGDHVVGDSGVACGSCEHCKNKHYSNCNNIRSVGTINCWDGAFADYFLMPQRHLYKLPDSISMKNAALIEPVSIALAGFLPEVTKEAKSVLIIGTGSIALAAVPLAKALGIEKVILSGRNPFKLNIAKQVGADIIIDSKNQSVGQAVRDNTDGIGVDLVIEASGNISTIADAVDAVKYNGHVSLIGFYETRLNDFKIDMFVMKSVTMKGVMSEFGAPKRVIDLIQEHNIDFTPLITRECTPEEAVDLIAEKDGVDKQRIKTMICYT